MRVTSFTEETRAAEDFKTVFMHLSGSKIKPQELLVLLYKEVTI